MKKDRNIFVLDTSAILTFIEVEEGTEEIEGLLIKAEKGEINIFVVFISLLEVFYITMQEKGEDEALRRVKLIQSLPVQVVESNEAFTLKAGSLKATNRMSLADAYIASVALELSGTLVHKDPEFENLKPPVEETRLPYKK